MATNTPSSTSTGTKAARCSHSATAPQRAARAWVRRPAIVCGPGCPRSVTAPISRPRPSAVASGNNGIPSTIPPTGVRPFVPTLCSDPGVGVGGQSRGSDPGFQMSDNSGVPKTRRSAMSPISLTRHLIEEQHAGRINADLRLLIEVVARACKSISIAVGKGALGGVLGEAGTGNIQGEAQKKLDVLSNEILLEANAWGGHLAGLASEEMDHSQPIPDAARRGRYLLLFDPLDGSSNIDVNVSVGTIFSVLRCPEGVTEPSDEHFLQPGTAQVAAGYTVYGPSTLLVLTTGHGTHVFTLDREVGSFLLTRRDVQIPADTQEFAINMSNQRHWEPATQRYIADLLAGKTGPRGK